MSSTPGLDNVERGQAENAPLLGDSNRRENRYQPLIRVILKGLAFGTVVLVLISTAAVLIVKEHDSRPQGRRRLLRKNGQ